MIGGQPKMVNVSHGLLTSLQLGVERTWADASLTLKVFGRMLVGQASLKNLSGPITIADYAGQSARTGVTPFLSFLAYISVSLGVLNLLPLPMLDGGHLLYYLFRGSERPSCIGLVAQAASTRWRHVDAAADGSGPFQ